jgi:hypothetical protein
MLRVRLTSYLQLLWGSGFTGFNVAFVAFWLLWTPEAVWLVIAAITPGAGGVIVQAGSPDWLAWTLLDAAVIFAVYGLVYALLFQLLFFVVRMTAAVLSHGQKLIGRITPGVAVFLLAGEPLLRQAGVYFGSPDPAAGLLWALAPPAILISLAVGVALIYVSPAFRGYNATFALVSAVVARIVLFPVDPGASAAGFLIYELTLLLTAFFVFITIQIRYRLHLWPNYEAIVVPDRFVRIGGVIAVFCALLYVAVELPWFTARTAQNRLEGKEGAGYFIPTAVWFVCALQWTLTAWLLDRGRLVSLNQQKERVQAAVLRSLTIAIVALSAVLFALTGFPRAGLARITAAHSTGGELLYLTGMLLDRDRDGNSLWPGRDPDDRDPCVRADFQRSCAKRTKSSGGDALQGQDPAPAVAVLHNPGAPRIPRPAAGNVILLTWVTEKLQIPDEPPPIPVYFAANRAEFALRALLRNTDGIGESDSSGSAKLEGNSPPGEAIALPSKLARSGYRTICTGRAPERDYYRTGHAAHLDAGCQVFQPLDDLARNTSGNAAEQKAQSGSRAGGADRAPASNINRTVLEGLFVFERYREAGSNFLWIHYEGHGNSLSAATANRENDSRDSNRRPAPAIERETLFRLQQAGDVVIMQMRPDDYTGNAYLLGRRQPRELPEHPRPGELLRFAAGLRSAAPHGARDQIVAIYERSFSESWFVRSGRRLGGDYPGLPVYTMRLDAAGMPMVFNALTGLTLIDGLPAPLDD